MDLYFINLFDKYIFKNIQKMAKNVLVENIFWNIFSKYFWPYFGYL